MACGIGLDLCDINSIKNMSNKEGFIRKYLSTRESEYVEGKGKSADQTLAGMIAAKEAFVKMLGTEFEFLFFCFILLAINTRKCYVLSTIG